MDRVQQFWDAHAQWSQATFGTDSERGPIGALKHLTLEAQEAAAKPGDYEEYADCLLLLFDASRRAGLTLDTLLDIAWMKLDKCKRRIYPKPTGDEPVEHIRGIHD